MFAKVLMSALLCFSAQLGWAESSLQTAESYFAQRDYNSEGIKNVEQAILNYEEAKEQAVDPVAELVILGKLATAEYFLGSALTEKDDKKAAHVRAMAWADNSLQALGVNPETAHELSQNEINQLTNQLGEDEQLLLAEAMYSKGVSLAQWGNLSGVASSIGRLPEVLGLMDRIEMLDQSQISDYGPYRTIGRINFVLPAIFGGDLAKSEEFLTQAYRKTLLDGERYSVNGYNNLYLAETMYKRGRENQAKRLLETFLQVDVETLDVNMIPENREAYRLAEELLTSWN